MNDVDVDLGALTCMEVLSVLSDYLDGELPVKQHNQVEAHVRGCDACTKFGGEFAAVVTALRKTLATK
jgi:anti-sigma factor RsiW